MSVRYRCVGCSSYSFANDGAPERACPRCAANAWEVDRWPSRVAPEEVSLTIEDVRRIVREEIATIRAAERAVNRGRGGPKW